MALGSIDAHFVGKSFVCFHVVTPTDVLVLTGSSTPRRPRACATPSASRSSRYRTWWRATRRGNSSYCCNRSSKANRERPIKTMTTRKRFAKLLGGGFLFPLSSLLRRTKLVFCRIFVRLFCLSCETCPSQR